MVTGWRRLKAEAYRDNPNPFAASLHLNSCFYTFVQACMVFIP